jgi:hypothetical protein
MSLKIVISYNPAYCIRYIQDVVENGIRKKDASFVTHFSYK